MSVPKFTESGRRVFMLANAEAAKCNCDVVGPEHVLLSLLSFEDSLAASILRKCNLDAVSLRNEVMVRVDIPETESAARHRPMTLPAKKIV